MHITTHDSREEAIDMARRAWNFRNAGPDEEITPSVEVYDLGDVYAVLRPESPVERVGSIIAGDLIGYVQHDGYHGEGARGEWQR